MPTVLTFTGGKRCEECEDQIDPRRLRINPKARLCTSCEQDWEMQQRAALSRTGPADVVIIRR